jgi:hypothetical protein
MKSLVAHCDTTRFSTTAIILHEVVLELGLGGAGRKVEVELGRKAHPHPTSYRLSNTAFISLPSSLGRGGEE